MQDEMASVSIESKACNMVSAATMLRVIEEDLTNMANKLYSAHIISDQTWAEVLRAGRANPEKMARILHAAVATSLSEDGSLFEKLVAILAEKNLKRIATELNKNLTKLRKKSGKPAASVTKYLVEDSVHCVRYPAPYRVRLLLVGTTDVGKTAIYNRYASDTYSELKMATFGIVTYKKHAHIIGKAVEVELVDTPGRRGFGIPTTMETHGALLVYDINNNSSFDKIKPMVDSLRQCLPPEAVLVLVGNKTDVSAEERKVLKSDAAKFAKKSNLTLFEVSAKTGKKVEEMFEECIKMVLHKIDTEKLYTFYNPKTELPPRKKR